MGNLLTNAQMQQRRVENTANLENARNAIIATLAWMLPDYEIDFSRVKVTDDGRMERTTSSGIFKDCHAIVHNITRLKTNALSVLFKGRLAPGDRNQKFRHKILNSFLKEIGYVEHGFNSIERHREQSMAGLEPRVDDMADAARFDEESGELSVRKKDFLAAIKGWEEKRLIDWHYDMNSSSPNWLMCTTEKFPDNIEVKISLPYWSDCNYNPIHIAKYNKRKTADECKPVVVKPIEGTFAFISYLTERKWPWAQKLLGPKRHFAADVRLVEGQDYVKLLKKRVYPEWWQKCLFKKPFETFEILELYNRREKEKADELKREN